MRKREKELELQLAEKAEELKAKQKQLDEQRAQMQAMQLELNASSEQIKKLHARESDVVSAMAQIESLRVRKLNEAEEHAAQIREEAKKTLDNARIEAESILANAKREAENARNAARAEADKSLEEAQTKADNLLAQAEASRQEYMQNTEQLNSRLASVAAECKAQLEAMQSFMERLHVSEEQREGSEEIEDMRKALNAEPVSTPESYDDPAELMKNIYTIEKRDLPTQEQSEESEENQAPQSEAPKAPKINAWWAKKPEPEEESERVWTVDEIVDSVMEENDKETEDGYLEKLIEEILQ